MEPINLCISIPSELEQYTKRSETKINNIDMQPADFGVKLVKNNQGELEYAAYFSNTGELIKKIYYKDSSVSCIIHYRNNLLYSDETYSDGHLRRKIKYDNNGKIISCTNFQYDKNYQVVSIKKFIHNDRYEVKYGYDELNRVNSRQIFINSKEVNNQLYMYDILDRIAEYKDSNQKIVVKKMNQKNQLVNYVVTDNLGNVIEIQNKYMTSEYLGTTISLNGHKTSVFDKSYIDNILLKKPYTGEDDLDFSISGMSAFANNENLQNEQHKKDNYVSNIIEFKKSEKPLPITIRKKLLIMRA